MQALTIAKRPTMVATHRTTDPVSRTALAGAAEMVAAVLFLLAMVPALASAGGGAPGAAPEPMPAPAPAVVDAR
jgi:hypothetical protein